MVHFLGVPNRSELLEQQYFLMLQVNGYGLNLSRGDIMRMKPRERHWYIEHHQKVLQQIRDEMEKKK